MVKQAPVKIHEQAGSNVMTPLSDEGTKPGTDLLAEKECRHHKQVSVPGKAHRSEDPQGDDKGNRDMYGKDPLPGKFWDMDAPVTEGDVQQQDEQ
jgi:hypothetical protein